MEEKQQKLQRLLALVEDTMTNEQFMKAFEQVVNFVLEIKKQNEADRNDIKDEIKKLSSELVDGNTGQLEAIKKQVETLKSDMEEKIKLREDSMFAILQDKLNMIKDGEDGKDADEEKVKEAVLAEVIPTLPTLKNLEENIPQLGEKIRDGLELLQGEERLDVSAIKGIDEKFSEVRKEISSIPRGGGGSVAARDFVQDIDLTSQLDGATTTFNIQAVWNIVSVSLSSYPYGALRKNVDYTWTPTSITFTSEIDPATQLASGQKCIITAIIA